jgi:hypothetical protein
MNMGVDMTAGLDDETNDVLPTRICKLPKRSADETALPSLGGKKKKIPADKSAEKRSMFDQNLEALKEHKTVFEDSRQQAANWLHECPHIVHALGL